MRSRYSNDDTRGSLFLGNSSSGNEKGAAAAAVAADGDVVVVVALRREVPFQLSHFIINLSIFLGERARAPSLPPSFEPDPFLQLGHGHRRGGGGCCCGGPQPSSRHPRRRRRLARARAGASERKKH